MGTPRGAEHRDLEQRFRHLERVVRELVSAALSRNVLRVDEGDFQVTGGGDVVVRDGGKVVALYPDGVTTAVELGPVKYEGQDAGVRLRLMQPNGISPAFDLYYLVPGADPAYPNGLSWLKEYVDQATISGATDLTLAGPRALIRDDGSGLTISNNGTQIECLDAIRFQDEVYVSGIPTTSNSANLRMTPSNGRLLQVTSSLRYKQDVERPKLDTAALLQVQPATWRDRAEVERDPDTEARYLGLIAEDLDELGLHDLIDYDDQGRPDAVRYDRLAVPLLELVKEQQSRLDDQERRLAALEAAAGA